MIIWLLNAVYFCVCKQGIRYRRPETMNTAHEISTRYREKDFALLIGCLREVGGDDLVRQFRDSCFGQFTDWKGGYKHNMALHHLISRSIESDDDLIWFHICGRDVCLTVADFALITGLRFGETTFDPTAVHDVSNDDAYLAFCGDVGSVRRPMSIKALIERVVDTRRRVGDERLYLRAVLVCVAQSFVLGYERSVEDWMWALAADLEAFNSFPWGAYSYQSLRYYLEHCARGQKYSFYGPAWALYVWGLEKVRGLGGVVGRVKDAGAYPRCLRWVFRSNTRVRAVDLQRLFEQTEVLF